MSINTTSLLAEGAGRFRQVHGLLTGPGPLRPALTQARRPEVWMGTVRDAFIGWLDMADRLLRDRVAPGLDTLAGWSERRAQESENYQKGLTAAAPGLVAPTAPAPLGHPGPGAFPPYAPYRGPVTGFAGMDPALVRELATLLGRASQEIYGLGNTINATLGNLAGLMPPDAAEAAGVAVFGQLSGSLQEAVRDLTHRAEQAEIGFAAGSLLTGATATFESTAGNVAGAAPVPGGVTKRAVRPHRPVVDVSSDPTAQGRAAYLRDKDLQARWEAGDRSVGEELMAIQDRLAYDAAYRAGYEEEPILAREAGKADAERLRKLMWSDNGECPDFDDVTRFLQKTNEAHGTNPAYCDGFAEAVASMEFDDWGKDQDGFGKFLQTARVCWINDHSKSPEELSSKFFRPMGEMLATATHDVQFDVETAKKLFTGYRASAQYLLAYGKPSTEVTLLAAEDLIDPKAWKKGDQADNISLGLDLLTRDPEAAHLYAVEHGDLLMRGTDAGLFRDPTGGGIFPDSPGSWDRGAAQLAADVLRIGLVEYPAAVAAAAVVGTSDLEAATAAAVGAAGEMRRAAAKAMADAIEAVGKGADLDPPGKLVLAEFLAENITDVAASLTTQVIMNRRGQLAVAASDIETAFKEVMSDPGARKVLLGGANVTVAGWGLGLADRAGDRLDQDPQLSLREAVVSVSQSTDMTEGASNLGEFYGQLGAAVLANVDDEREAAAEMAVMLSFLATKGITAAGSARSWSAWRRSRRVSC